MLSKEFIQVVNNELSQSLDFCVWGNNITEGIIRSTIEASILFLGYLKPNKRTSSIVFTHHIDGDFLFNIKSTFLNDGNDNTYVLSLNYEDISEGDEDIYYFTDIPELSDFLKIYARNNYEIYYSSSHLGEYNNPDIVQITFYIIPVIFTCIQNYVADVSISQGILEVKDCVRFKLYQGGIKTTFQARVKQLFKSDKYLEIMNNQ